MRDLFSEIVQWSWQKFRYDLDNKRPDAAEWYGLLAGRYAPVTSDKDLRGLLPQESDPAADLYDTRAILVLDAITQGDVILPFLTMKYNFGADDGKVWIHIGLLCRDALEEELFDSDVQCANKFRSIGFRVEPPEEPNGPVRSNHDYYHVQPLRLIRRGDTARLPRCPAWFPDQWPTWPIHACNPVQAFLAVLVGLYGLNAIKALLQDNGMPRNAREAVVDYARLIAKDSFPAQTPPVTRRKK